MGVCHFVAKVVRPAAVGVHVIEVAAQAPRQHPGYDMEIFVMVRRQPMRVMLRLCHRAAQRRQRRGNLDFRWAHGFAESAVRRRGAIYGITATFISPFRCFMCWNMEGSSCRGISALTKSRARISPRAMASMASRIKRGVWWKVDLMVISE